jgi:hypothetical protein
VNGFRDNVAYSPIPLEEFRQVNEGLRLMMVPEYGILTETAEGEVTSFIYVHPDWAPLFRELNGTLDIEIAQRHLTECHKRRLILNTFVIRREYRKSGHADLLLYLALSAAFGNGISSGVGSLAKEGPTFYARLGAPSREYTLYSLNT